MRRIFSRILAFVLLLAFLVVVSLFLILPRLDLDPYRVHLEQQLSHALGIQLGIHGPLRVSFQPQPTLTMEDVQLRHGGGTIPLHIERLAVSIALWPLLQQELRISSVMLEHALLSLSPRQWPLAVGAQQNEAGQSVDEGMRWSLAEQSVYQILDSRLVFDKPGRPGYTELSGLQVTLHAGKLSAQEWRQKGLAALKLNGHIAVSRITTEQVELDKLQARLSFEAKQLRLSDINTEVFAGKGYGDFTLDVSHAQPLYSLNARLVDFEAGEFLTRVNLQELIKGPLNLYVDLNWSGRNAMTMLQHLNGHLNLGATGLSLNSIDIDSTISTFEQSQRFNLVDLGAYFFIGPVGSLATKGYAFTRILKQSDTAHSRIESLVSDWTISNGIAVAEDVAFSTRKNRIALQGKLDLPSAQFEDLVFAVLDRQGCAVYSQRIHGPLTSPVVEPPRKFAILLAPVLDALETPRALLGDERCTPFYSGQLAHPTNHP